MQRKALLIHRDGALIKAPSTDDQLELLAFIPGVIRNLYFIRKNLDFDLVVMKNKDEAEATESPQENADLQQAKMLEIFAGEGVVFDKILFNEINFSDEYDLINSYIISDRTADMLLAENLGCKGILLTNGGDAEARHAATIYTTTSWDQITELLFAGERQATVQRTTNETAINIRLNLDGNGVCDISTGIGFFDHLLEQIGKHGGLDLTIKVRGDLFVDEHHTIEDTSIALGEAVYQALGNKRGIERYGYCLPMDDCLCSVAIDFGGRAWLVWDAQFRRERVGDMPTEMIFHFFKSFSDAAKMNLNIKAEGENEHHKAEGIFKALAKAIKMAVKRDVYKYDLPSTKGVL